MKPHETCVEGEKRRLCFYTAFFSVVVSKDWIKVVFKIEDSVGSVFDGLFFVVAVMLLHVCQYYVYFGEFLAMSILWDGNQEGLACC